MQCIQLFIFNGAIRGFRCSDWTDEVSLVCHNATHSAAVQNRKDTLADSSRGRMRSQSVRLCRAV